MRVSERPILHRGKGSVVSLVQKSPDSVSSGMHECSERALTSHASNGGLVLRREPADHRDALYLLSAQPLPFVTWRLQAQAKRGG